MFEKSRRKIVAAIMSVLVLLWVGTLSIIYSSSYIEMSKRNVTMMATHAQMFVLSADFIDMPPIMPKPEVGIDRFDPGFEESPMFRLTTFYTVALTYEGEIIEINNTQQDVYSNSDLQKIAEKVFCENKTSGTYKNLAFYKADKSGYVLVVFADNTVINENAATLFRYTLIFGGIFLIMLFFVSVFLAKKIVHPLEESYKKQKQFISDAGHELKTPIAVVNANAELLSREIGNNQWLDNILYENERMGMLVRQLLELARTENVVSQKEYLDFSRLVQGEALPFESVAFEMGLTLVCDTESGISVEGNASQLKQLVAILLDNAVRYSKDSDKIRLRLTKEHGFAILSVINKGERISEEQLKQIFERFYRVDEARNGDDKHYGLGLAIAKSITEAHKGKIEAICQEPYVEFRVALPLYKN